MPDESAASEAPGHLTDAERALVDRYWRRNVTLMTALLAIWALVSLGCGVLFADALNAWQIGGFPLGFWFAQQGSIIVFVLLILVYALAMTRLDRAHHEERQALDESLEGDRR